MPVKIAWASRSENLTTTEWERRWNETFGSNSKDKINFAQNEKKEEKYEKKLDKQ
jgi:hypothetical protein